MSLTRRFFIWNIMTLLISLAISALLTFVYAGLRARWLAGGEGSGSSAMSETVTFLGLSIPAESVAELYVGVGLTGLVSFLVIFLTLNIWVASRFSRGIISPIVRLTEAAKMMSEGDLGGGIAEEGEGEVQELSRSLEQMRIKLKESIYLQQRYDENRKFLLSSISHDLKTPVTAIRGYIEGIIDGVAAAPDKQQQYLEVARSKTLLVNNMIDDLLLYSKLDLNQLPYHFELTDMRTYFEYCLDDHRYEYDRSGVKLRLVDELEGPVTIRIDVERFKRVMQNVLDNALKHAPAEEGIVELILRETRTSAIIEVRDNGPGIPEDHLPHIFDRFYRADASRSNLESSGLGLAIAKQIVEGHEGRIWAVSRIGEGTRIMISLLKH